METTSDDDKSMAAVPGHVLAQGIYLPGKLVHLRRKGLLETVVHTKVAGGCLPVSRSQPSGERTTQQTDSSAGIGY